MPTPPANLNEMSDAELRQLVLELLDKIGDLERRVGERDAEIARLKGLKGKPKLKPSGLEAATGHAGPNRAKKRRGKAAKTAALTAHEERVIRAAVPPGSRFKGYQSFVAQDLVLRPHIIRFRRERWRTPDGRTVITPLPAEVDGHFGPALQRFLLVQYHQGQVTVPRLVMLLRDLGLVISKRQIIRLLTDRQPFAAEADAVLRTGLETARWLTVDDTGARHKAANNTCTQIGDDRFTAFATTGSKSRLNFLELLRAGHGDYVINAAALGYMRRRAMPQHAITRLAGHPTKRFADERAWTRHLRRLGIDQLKHSLDPVRLAIWPAKARCGAVSRRMASCPIR